MSCYSAPFRTEGGGGERFWDCIYDGLLYGGVTKTLDVKAGDVVFLGGRTEYFTLGGTAEKIGSGSFKPAIPFSTSASGTTYYILTDGTFTCAYSYTNYVGSIGHWRLAFINKKIDKLTEYRTVETTTHPVNSTIEIENTDNNCVWYVAASNNYGEYKFYPIGDSGVYSYYLSSGLSDSLVNISSRSAPAFILNPGEKIVITTSGNQNYISSTSLTKINY